MGGMNDHSGWYSAPAAIQALSVSFWAAVSCLWIEGGGITSSLSVAKMRWIISLSSGLPGAMAPALTATSRRSNRRSAFREALSGPWQAKQFSARIGRTSRLKLSFSAAVATKAGSATSDAIAHNQAWRRWTIGGVGLCTASRPHYCRKAARGREKRHFVRSKLSYFNRIPC